jgi:hypothetical protein
MITSGREWIGDSDMNTSAADRDYLQPDEGDDLEELCERIRTLAAVYRNYDTEREAAALKAASEGRAAWWTDLGYSNQSALLVAFHANRRSLAAALAVVADDLYPSESRHRAYLIEHMIPLNDRARAEKAKLVRDDVASKGRVA